MPELPEVHTTVTSLNRLLPGLRISDVWTSYGGIIHKGKGNIKDKNYFARFKKKVVGKKIKSVTRRAKNVLINLENGESILVHMKMTGHLLDGKYKEQKKSSGDGWRKEQWVPQEKKTSPLWDPFNRFIRLVFSFSNGKNLVLSDMRKFAKVCLVGKDDNELGALGPEPLEKSFNFGAFKERLDKKPDGKIKQILMNQQIIAGIGNIYSDELLWISGVHPESKFSKIPEKKRQEMFEAMKEVLRKGIDFRGDSTSDYRKPDGSRGTFQHHHKAYRQTGKKCPRGNCSGVIKRLKLGGRSAHFCDKHQKKY
jgi:formamidopyrimidine-DNA glycosylase